MLRESLVAAVLSLTFAGCQRAPESDAKPSDTKQTAGAIPETSVADVQKLVTTKSATVLDANSEETRKEYGVVPGATLLSSSRNYPLSELPSDKGRELVFYCGGVKCRASDSAAKRAAEAGYSKVSVMRAGIRGWKAAGAPTQPLPQS
jgi:rhodanese-related sulfurtransferase